MYLLFFVLVILSLLGFKKGCSSTAEKEDYDQDEQDINTNDVEHHAKIDNNEDDNSSTCSSDSNLSSLSIVLTE